MSKARIDSDHPEAGQNATRWTEVHRSVFAKLVIVMGPMAACLLVLVGVFFWFIVGPNLHSSVDRLLEEYTTSLAAGAPDLAAAKKLSERLNIQVRYEGPAGNWSTDSLLPSVDDVRRGIVSSRNSSFLSRNYYAVPAPDGGAYLFAWSLGSRMSEIHSALVMILLTLMAAVVVTTHFVLKRLLAPLRVLNEGVASLAAGRLDVVLPNKTRDEFGRLTEAFNRMVSRVRSMIGARDQLLLDVSHELRSPLTRMKVALELMPPGEQRTGMMSDVAEMERMVTELLELERLRSGRGLQISRQDLVSLLRETVGGFQGKAPGVRLIASEGGLMVDIDGEKIRAVLRNLLENAAKYSLPQSRPVEISTAQDDDKILITVKDDGPGIPEDEMERVFEPFYRIDRSRSKTTGGYGLGLSICKRVMQAHGGDIVLERHPCTGATFILTLPKPV